MQLYFPCNCLVGVMTGLLEFSPFWVTYRVGMRCWIMKWRVDSLLTGSSSFVASYVIYSWTTFHFLALVQLKSGSGGIDVWVNESRPTHGCLSVALPSPSFEADLVFWPTNIWSLALICTRKPIPDGAVCMYCYINCKNLTAHCETQPHGLI